MFDASEAVTQREHKPTGQAVVEFALILLILLLIIFVVIESARIFQANLTAQNAARDAGRYAITGEFDPSCLADSPPCDDPRLVSVKARALEGLSGLRLDPNASFNEPYYYLIEVFSLDDGGNWIPDTVGGPGDPVLVRVTYRLGIVTPLVSSIARTVQVRGQVVYNNEESQQTSLTSGANPGSDDAPNLPPLPTSGPTPTATPIPPVLAIDKVASDSEVTLGETIDYTIVVENQGGGPATNVVLTDNLPGEVSFGSASAGCTPVGGAVECNLGELGPSESATISIQVNTESVGTAVNTAEVTSDEVGPVSDPASTVIIDPSTADLDISKTAPSLQMTAGETFDYTIDVRNLGPADANNIVVTDVLDDGLTYENVTTTLGTCNISGSTVTCSYAGPLAANGAHMLITLTVTAVDVGQISNTATVTADETDPDNSNNSSTAVISVDPAADLLIEKSVEPDTIGVREFMTYTLAITNLGPEPATNVTVIDNLPAGVGIVSISPSQGWCEQQPDTNAEILCGLGTLAVDGVAEVEIVAIPTVADQHVTNTADVYANELDPQPGNNTASVSIFIEPRADLSITKTASESRVHVDDPLIYTLEVTNSPDSFTDAPNVVASDQLPGTRLNVETAVPTQGDCEISLDDLVVCRLGDMAPGDVASIEITVDLLTVDAEGNGGGDLFNSAGVEYGNGSGTIYEDLDPSNNSDEITIYVGPGAEAISTEPVCGDPGESVIISGTGWTTSGPHDMTITFDPGGAFETVYDGGTVQPNADGSWTIDPITVPDGMVAPDNWGFYTILVQGRTDEEAEAQFEFPCPAPDLTPTSLELTSPPAVSTESTSFDVVIENVGRVDSGAFTIAIYFDGSTDPVATQGVGGLNTGETRTVTVSTNGFPDHGQHSVQVLVDSTEDIDEELETNNTIENEFLVLARPEAVDDEYTTDEDVELNVSVSGVLSNDTDADGPQSELAAELVSGPSDGSLTLNPDGSFTYMPDQDFNETDTFTYEACDSGSPSLCSIPATVTITVNPVNDNPVAVDDAVTVDEDGAATIDVLANDTDVDGDTLTVDAIVTQPSNGTVTDNDVSVTYDPDPDFFGTDTFEYRVSDGKGGTDTATVTVTVDAVNDPPVAEDDNYTVSEDGTLTVSAPGILDNDSDVDDPLDIIANTTPGNGSFTFGGDGSFEYVPDADFCDTVTFTYTLSDGTTSDMATVTIDVTCVNDGPDAVDDNYQTDEDTPLSVAPAAGVLDNDSDVDDPLAISANTNPPNGQLTFNSNDGSFEYEPDADFCGTDTFTYTLDDGNATATATVSILVNCVPDAPLAAADTYIVQEDGTLTVDAQSGVLANDTDGDGDTLTATNLGDPGNGTFTFNSDGSFTYTPNGDFNGSATFDYQVCDPGGLCDEATVTITVDSVNDAPDAVDDSATTDEDTTVNIDILANDSDADSDDLAVSITAQPGNGTLTPLLDGTYDYTPDDDYCNTDQFTYSVDDGNGGTDTATVTITVTCVNDAPVAVDDNDGTTEDVPLTVAAPGVLGNDTDAENDALTATLANQAGNGTVTLNADGSFTYTPDDNYCGQDTFTYTVSDGTDSDTGLVTITVDCVADDPVAVNDTADVDEDTPTPINVAANDTDGDGNLDLTSVAVTAGPGNGSLDYIGDGTFTYTPAANYNGDDTFTYQICDTGADGVPSNGDEACDTALVSISVVAVNDAPVAGDDSGYTVDEDSTLTVTTSSLLDNDTDVEGDILTTSLDSPPANGTATVNSDGTFTYTPNADFCGDDSFTYLVSDGSDSDEGSVTVSVTCVNDPVNAVNDVFNIYTDTPRTIDVVANDTGIDVPSSLTVTIVSGPTMGTAVVNTDNTITYTPDAGVTSVNDSFTYLLSDGDGDTDTATTTLSIIPQQ